MWSLMQQWDHEILSRETRARGTHEKDGYESLPVARARGDRLIHHALAWLGRQRSAWQALQLESDRSTARLGGKRSIPSGEPIREVL